MPTELASYAPTYPPDLAGPVLQVVGPNWMNRGDQLMLHAIDAALGGRYRLTTPMMLRVPLDQVKTPRNAWLMTRDAWARFQHRRRHGAPRIVLDCSGYQYGDPWKQVLPMLQMRARYYRRFVDGGGTLIVLPQCFGPFADPEVAAMATAVMSRATLIFARDATSCAHLLSLGCGAEARVRMAPDFTNTLPAVAPPDPAAWAGRVAIIPNRQVHQRGGQVTRAVYVAALAGAARRVAAAGREPTLLLHDSQDRDLAEAVAAQVAAAGGPVLRIHDPAAREAKGILAHCLGVIGSRYHGIISALSQGVPTVGTAWAHKYQELFADYACPQMLVPDMADPAAWDAPLAGLLDPEARRALAAALPAAAEQQRARTAAMWRELDAAIRAAGA